MYKPLGDRIVIRHIDNTTKSGIIYTDHSKSDGYATVLAISDDAETHLQPGDKVLYLLQGVRDLSDGNIVINVGNVICQVFDGDY